MNACIIIPFHDEGGNDIGQQDNQTLLILNTNWRYSCQLPCSISLILHPLIFPLMSPNWAFPGKLQGNLVHPKRY